MKHSPATFRKPLALLGIGLLAATSLLITALAWATLRGLRNGSLLAPEAAPAVTPAAAAA